MLKNDPKLHDPSHLNDNEIELIGSLFLNIDKKVISLHQCSTNDFLALNQSFKKHHEFIKTAIKIVSEVFKCVKSKEYSVLNKAISNYTPQLKSNYHDLEVCLNENISVYDELYDTYNASYISCSNIKQDLGTLKLALTNMKIELNDVHKEKPGVSAQFIDEYIEKFNHVINHPGDSLSKLSQISKDCVRKSKEESIELLSLYKKCITDFTSIEDLIKEQMHFIHTNSDNLIKRIKTINEGISTIITNLQYEDIIKQRIEHIQLTHQEIIKKLNDSSLNKPENPSEEKAKLLMSIKEITGLQAAQLIHANKQYQGAIEKITKQFEIIGDSMEEAGGMFQKLTTLIPETLPETFKILNRENDALLDNKVFKLENLTPLTFVNTEYLKLTEDYHHALENICDLQGMLIELHNKIESSADKSSNLLKQIGQIIKDIRIHLTKLDDVVLKAQNYNQRIKESKFGSYNIFKKSFKQVLEKQTGFHKTLSELDKTFISILHEGFNKNLNQTSFSDIKNSIHEVKYYNYFEKTIEEIIAALNTVYQRLYNDNMNLTEVTKSSMEHIKKRYTMESEFLIHDYVLNSKLDSINKVQHDINKKIYKRKTKDDNLELF